jgi:hypothetical protein
MLLSIDCFFREFASVKSYSVPKMAAIFVSGILRASKLIPQ